MCGITYLACYLLPSTPKMLLACYHSRCKYIHANAHPRTIIVITIIIPTTTTTTTMTCIYVAQCTYMYVYLRTVVYICTCLPSCALSPSRRRVRLGRLQTAMGCPPAPTAAQPMAGR